MRTKKLLMSDFAPRLEDPSFALIVLNHRGQRPFTVTLPSRRKFTLTNSHS
jgi:hypothetical protein